MQFKPIVFEGFNGRDEALRKIIRYITYTPMYYRTNDLGHSQRVCWLVEELIPLAEKVYGSNFDGEKARTLARVHDDAEIITGDIQLGNKLLMTAEELAKVKYDEENAIEIISKRFPKSINGYSYRELLLHSLKKDCLEALLVKFCDKLDAFGEALHELAAGNRVFETGLPIGVRPPKDTYTKILSTFSQTHPEISALMSEDHPLFKPPQNIIFSSPSFHTEESILKKTGHIHYDYWKELTLKKGGQQGLRMLIERVE